MFELFGECMLALAITGGLGICIGIAYDAITGRLFDDQQPVKFDRGGVGERR